MLQRFFILVTVFVALSLPGRVVEAQGKFAIPDLEEIVRVALPSVDALGLQLADERRAANGRVPHYAVALEVRVSPWGDDGTWDQVADKVRWRVRLHSPEALSLNLAFGRYRMPPRGRLFLTSADGRYRVGPFSDLDNDDHGQLWTPPILTDDLVVELQIPLDELANLELELTKVHHGYAGFGEPEPKSGDCHRDVACSEADPWSEQARSVGLVSVSGTRFCTGFLVNNTAFDGRPFFLTASHCGVTAHNAASVVVLWKHQRTLCGDDTSADDGEWAAFQTGALVRASHRPADMVLLELDDQPDPVADVFYAGWDRTLTDPKRSTVIHHPNTDVKRISFDADTARTTAHLADESRPGGDHLRIGAWDLGSTEGGSSGAPLFNHDKRVVGTLHGGYAACGAPQADWFGRFSAAWTGRGRSGFRLSDWLDPLDTGVQVLDGASQSDLAAESE